MEKHAVNRVDFNNTNQIVLGDIKTVLFDGFGFTM